jgi:hypothetical protein
MKRWAFVCLAFFAALSGCGSGRVSVPDIHDTGTAGTGGGDPIQPERDGGGLVQTAPDGGGPVQPGTDGGPDSGPESGAVSCTSDKECTDHGLLCDILAGICVGCLYDIDCGDQANCVNNECISITICENSLDCIDDVEDRTVCDESRGECVECVAENDCPENHDCIDNRCVEFAPCANSLDCPEGMVCNQIMGRCLDCVRDNDCEEGQVCVSSTCRVGCDSDNDCTPLGLLCNISMGYCVSCFGNNDCPEVLHCSQGECVRDICRAGSSSCSGNSMVRCNDAGDGFISPTPCLDNQTCVESGATASCQDWVCNQAGARICDSANEKVIDCAEDGLSFSVIDDCDARNQLCLDADCLPLICLPDQFSCDGDDRVMQCNSLGTAETEYDDCAANEWCDGADPQCRAQICTPDQPVCDNNVATTCNERGSGYTGTETNCTTIGRICVDGVCLEQVCVAEEVFCQDGDVVQCDSDGMGTTIIQDCLSTEYCDDTGVPQCTPQICLPDQPTCNGNNATTCNSEGSGYTGGSTDCTLAGEVCASGVCVDALFKEDFEDGDYSGWSTGSGSYTRTVTDTTAADGTLYSLTMTGGSGHHEDGLHYVFGAGLVANSISFWVRSGDTNASDAYFTGHNNTDASGTAIFFIYLRNTGVITNVLSGTYDHLNVPYVADTWYHIELRDFDWVNNNYDYYVNDTLISVNVPFRITSASSLMRLNLYNYSNSTAYWDEIIIR